MQACGTSTPAVLCKQNKQKLHKHKEHIDRQTKSKRNTVSRINREVYTDGYATVEGCSRTEIPLNNTNVADAGNGSSNVGNQHHHSKTKFHTDNRRGCMYHSIHMNILPAIKLATK